ncbi:MAG: FkbM family methyltransferase [Archangiaceae bacterium]|nr:FkbM family methyltransferase [Archangiaceae bacterium]
MNWRRSVIDGLLSVYGFANRRGLLDAPLAREAFARSYFLYKRAVEDPFAALLRKRPELFRGGHILDVGANIGYTAAVFAGGVDDGFKVFAFEPEEKNFAQLERTVSRLQLGAKVQAVHAAVGASDGTIELWRNDAHHGDHRIATDAFKRTAEGAVHTVPLVSLDRYVTGPVSFVKIDVQGFEAQVLEGMQRLLTTPITIAIEYMPEAISALGFEPQAMLAALTRAGFELNALQVDGSLSRFEPSNLGERGYVDLLCLRSRS